MWSNTHNMFKLLLALSALVSLSSSQQFREDNFEISDSNANSCETIVEASRFDGDCCSLNSTDAGGCVLNIVNGRCKITGQYWTIDWTSTYKQGGATCPPSEYPELASAAYATDAPAADDTPEDGATGMGVSAALILSSIAAGFMAIAL